MSGSTSDAANSARNQPYGYGSSASPSPGTYTAGSTGGNVVIPVAAPASNYGVTFFGDDLLNYYGPSKATVGNSNGAPFFFMTLEDSASVKNAHDAAVYTGMAPSAQKAYLNSGDINGFSFPIDGLNVAKPTAIDAGNYAHYLEGGNTAVKLEGTNAGYMVNSVKEFVTPGNSPLPSGSVQFKLGPNGEWIKSREW